MKTITNHNLAALISAVLREVNSGSIFKDAREVAGLYYAEVIESSKDLEPVTVEELTLHSTTVEPVPVQETAQEPTPEVKPVKKTRKTKQVEPEADNAEGD